MTHICIDGQHLALPYDTGIGTYGRTLIEALADMGHDTTILYGRNVRNSRQPALREALFFAEDPPDIRTLPRRLWRAAGALASVSHPVEIPRTGVVIRNDRYALGGTLFNARRLFQRAHLLFRLTGRMLTVPNPGGVTICHWTAPLPVRMQGARNIYTFHDLIPLRYPYLSGTGPAYFYRLAKAVAATASHIVTVSEHSRRELLDILPLDESRVTNTYQSVLPPSPTADAPGALQIYGLADKDYYLSFSAIDPRKNIARMIEAYLRSGTRRRLVIAGQFGWLGAADARMLSNMGLWNGLKSQPQSAGNIAFLGHVPRPHLDRLIRGAQAVLFPSVTEGFGLPIIEAMARGVPVLTSRGGATEEIAGGAALLVDPLHSASIAAGFRELDANPDLLGRLAHQGPGRAAMFTPKAYVERLRPLYA